MSTHDKSTRPGRGPPPERFGRYRVLSELGQGGMGIVYKAREDGLDRLVALKVVRPGLAASPGLMARFKREYTVHAELHHPNIVQFYDVGEEGDHVFYAMEYLDASPLDEVITNKQTTQEFDLIIRVAQALADSLAYLHPKEILHRDIKPANIMVENGTGRVVLMDFGLVKESKLTQLTREGRTVGSPRYMSPEMLEGTAADSRSDIYQAGVTLYQLCTGELPYNGEDLVSLATAIIRGGAPPPRLVNPAVSPSLSNLVMNCMARDPEDRYQQADQLVRDLRRLRGGLEVPIRARPPENAGSSESLSIPSMDSISVEGGRSGPIPRISTMSVDMQAPRRLPLIPMILAMVLLSTVPLGIGWMRNRTSFYAEQVEVISGVGAARIRWKGRPHYPTKVTVEELGEGAETRRYSGGGPDSDGWHQLILDPLEPGVDRVVRIEFPSGTSSFAYRIPPPRTAGPDLASWRVRPVHDELEVRLEVSPASRATLTLDAPGGRRELILCDDYRTHCEARIPAPPPEGSYSGVSIRLEAIGQTRVVDVDPILGVAARLEDFWSRLERVDMASVMSRLKEASRSPDTVVTRSLAGELMGLSDLELNLTLLEDRPLQESADASTWRVYEALRRLEAIDAWLMGEGRDPAIRVGEFYAPLVRLSRGPSAPAGGITVATLDIEDTTSFKVHGGTESSGVILAVYAATSDTRTIPELTTNFRLRDVPGSGGRAGLAIRVRNLSPEIYVEATLNDEAPFDLFNDAEGYPGEYWLKISGERTGKLWEHTNWIYAEIPSRLLRPGRNELYLRAVMADGLSPTHFVDFYEVQVWPRAPSFPGGS